MSDKIEVQISRQLYISVDDIIKGLDAADISEFLSMLSEKLDKDYSCLEITQRADYAEKFSLSLSELGVRFLTEVVTNYHARQYDK